jgi:hypothetical protein
MISRSCTLALGLLLFLTLTAPDVLAQDVVGISVLNTSSEMPNSSDLIERFYETSSTLGELQVDGSSASFTHRLAFLNSMAAGGSLPQVNKRNVIFQLTFTVEDPDAVGYQVDLSSVMRGVSAIEQTEGDGVALATGLSLAATYGIDTTDPAEFVLLPGFYGQNTGGASVSGLGAAAELHEDTASGPLGDGLFVGTRTFSVFFSSVPTPTTNVLLPNGNIGAGFVNYGLGSDVGDTGASPADLGHFLTVTVTFEGGVVASSATSWSGVKALFH